MTVEPDPWRARLLARQRNLGALFPVSGIYRSIDNLVFRNHPSFRSVFSDWPLGENF